LKLKSIRKNLLIGGGTLCVILAAVGIILPVLPTTPFLLLAAYFYARSSKKFYNWLLTNRWFGEYIRNYREGRGMPLNHKIISILLLWLTIIYAAWFVVDILWLKMILVGIAAGVTFHLVRVKTYKPENHAAESTRRYDLEGEQD
jgi:uncharacterized protein